MKISLAWLKEFVNLPADRLALADTITRLGLAVETLEKSGDDWVLDIDVPTNRPDCLNHFGVAREVSAALGSALSKPKYELKESGTSAEDAFAISISDPDLCPRYCGRYIAGVKIGPSPEWLKNRLEAVGLRSINNVADVTNYVLMELGQPLHSFDADTLEGRSIIVRRADLDEKITTLDGIERTLNPSVLVIADQNRAIAIAGVMGGTETEISASTTNVLLESAHFNPQSIRSTSRKLSLSTEASYRFERGSDIEMAFSACDRAAALIQELAGGQVYRGVIDVYPAKQRPVISRLRRGRISSFLGTSLDDATVERIFEGLAFKVTRITDGWSLEIPSFRADVSREEDLLEEIARHHGYDKLPATLPAWSGHGSYLVPEPEERSLRDLLAEQGYSESIGLAFSQEEIERQFRPATDPVKLRNPMAEDQSILRTSLVPTMLRALQWNINRGMRDLQFYELEKVYRAGSEHRALILAATGALRTKSVHEPERDFNFYDLKGDVEAILSRLRTDQEFGIRISDFGFEELQSEIRNPNSEFRNSSYYHPGRSVRYGDVAVFGELHPEYAELFKLRQRIYIAELDVATLLKSRRKLSVNPIPRFPSIRRDLSLLLEKTTRYADVYAAIMEAHIEELARVEPFDTLETGSFPASKYSLSISLIYQSSERTLTDTEVEKFDQRILDLLEQRLGAHLRS